MPDTPEKPPHSVFVSHAHADNDLCDCYVDALRRRGLDVWYDRTNMQDGHFLSQDIETQLRTRTALVLLITPASLASYWVRLEVGAFQSLAAQDPSRLMLPVRIAECEMPLLMMGIKWIDAVTLGFDATIGALEKALHAPTIRPPTPVLAEPVDDLLKLGGELWNRGKYKEAMATYDQALVRNPIYALAWNNKGNALRGIARYEEALAAYDQALSLDPTFAYVWHNKAKVLRKLGCTVESEAADRRARELGW